MQNKYIETKRCEVCESINLETVINLGNHPLCDDLVEFGYKRTCKEYPIVILFCKVCYTAYQKYQVPKKDLFPKTYHYRSRFTADVLSGMLKLVEDCEEEVEGTLKGKKVLDVGSNDGSLLNFFRDKGAITIGIEPTDAYKDGLNNGHVLYNDFFTEDTATKIKSENGSIDIVTFTNVFAHIEDLNNLLASLKKVISPKTIIVIENHYLGSIIKSYQFDTFYHEHPRTYSLKSFSEIAKKLEMNLFKAEFPARYGGNIRVYMGGNKVMLEKEVKALENDIFNEKHFSESLLKMQDYVEIWKTYMKNKIQLLVNKHGALVAKAFPGRAAILIKLLDLDEKSISVVYERPGSMKIGNYLPGTKIPIRSDDELVSNISSLSVILNLAWHIPKEIRSYLIEKGFKGKVIDIYSPNITL